MTEILLDPLFHEYFFSQKEMFGIQIVLYQKLSKSSVSTKKKKESGDK